MGEDTLARALSQWADGLAAVTRDQLSTYDLRALFDCVVRGRARDLEREVHHWVAELGPATRATLSAYDVARLLDGVRRLPASTNGREPPRTSSQTGEACPACGSSALVRTGTCLTCRACGSSTGCD